MLEAGRSSVQTLTRSNAGPRRKQSSRHGLAPLSRLGEGGSRPVGRELATRLHAGTVNINEGYIASWGSFDAPMGGMKDSGLGRRHGAPGILKYTEQQTVSVQRLMPLAPPPLVGQRLWARLITAGLRLLRWAHLR